MDGWNRTGSLHSGPKEVVQDLIHGAHATATTGSRGDGGAVAAADNGLILPLEHGWR